VGVAGALKGSIKRQNPASHAGLAKPTRSGKEALMSLFVILVVFVLLLRRRRTKIDFHWKVDL
jgi:hypothetical protein